MIVVLPIACRLWRRSTFSKRYVYSRIPGACISRPYIGTYIVNIACRNWLSLSVVRFNFKSLHSWNNAVVRSVRSVPYAHNLPNVPLAKSKQTFWFRLGIGYRTASEEIPTNWGHCVLFKSYLIRFRIGNFYVRNWINVVFEKIPIFSFHNAYFNVIKNKLELCFTTNIAGVREITRTKSLSCISFTFSLFRKQ